MKLRRPCEHDYYDEHPDWMQPEQIEDPITPGAYFSIAGRCPGGVFLPDDTLIISRQALVLMGAERFYVVQVRDDGSYPMPLFDFLDALSVREAE